MIGPADDFLIHQTHEPVRHAATSDRRFYDRYFFTGHQCSEDLFFMIGIGSYPNLGVIDAFGSVALGSRQYTTRASRESKRSPHCLRPDGGSYAAGSRTLQKASGAHRRGAN